MPENLRVGSFQVCPGAKTEGGGVKLSFLNPEGPEKEGRRAQTRHHPDPKGALGAEAPAEQVIRSNSSYS